MFALQLFKSSYYTINLFLIALAWIHRGYYLQVVHYYNRLDVIGFHVSLGIVNNGINVSIKVTLYNADTVRYLVIFFCSRQYLRGYFPGPYLNCADGFFLVVSGRNAA